MIYLIRHGQTEANAAHQYLGRNDSPLTEKGAGQHAAVLSRLNHIALHRIYTSPKERCAGLADALAEEHGIRTERDGRIAEMNFGVFEGLTHEQAKERHPLIWTQWEQAEPGFTLPGGESLSAFETRVGEFAESLKEIGENGNIAVVTHGGVIVSLLCSLLALGTFAKWRFRAENGSVVCIQITDGYAYLVL